MAGQNARRRQPLDPPDLVSVTRNHNPSVSEGALWNSNRASQFPTTAIVTPAWLDTSPTLSTIGTAFPG
jgi:hypothetical protein